MRAIDLTGGELTGQAGQFGVVYRIYVIGHKVYDPNGLFARTLRWWLMPLQYGLKEDLQASVHRRCTDCSELCSVTDGAGITLMDPIMPLSSCSRR
jgi:hypothetical protein